MRRTNPPDKPDNMALSARDIQRVCPVSPSPIGSISMPSSHSGPWPHTWLAARTRVPGRLSRRNCTSSLGRIKSDYRVRPYPCLSTAIAINVRPSRQIAEQQRRRSPALSCNGRAFGSSPLHLRHALASPRLASSRVRLGPNGVIDPLRLAKQQPFWLPGQLIRRCWDAH